FDSGASTRATTTTNTTLMSMLPVDCASVMDAAAVRLPPRRCSISRRRLARMQLFPTPAVGDERFDDSRAARAVAVQRRPMARRRGLPDRVDYPLGRGADQPVPACRHGFHPFRFVPERYARDLEEERLLLHSAGIRYNHARVDLQPDHVQIRQRLDHDRPLQKIL